MRRSAHAILFAALFATATPADAIEMPDYRVVAQDGAITIRQYEPMLLVQAQGIGPHNLFRQDQRPVFGVLFDYIRGENVSRDRIAMTNPVFVEPGAPQRIDMTNPVFVEPDDASDAWTMSFFLPERFDLQTAPEPTREGVTVTEYPAMQVAVIRFSGIMTAAREAEHLVRLEAWIDRNGLEVTGSRLLGFYDPPWVPGPFRTNEVMLPVAPAVN